MSAGSDSSIASPDSPKVQFPCASCRGAVLAGFEHLGRKGRCPHCDGLVIVPFIRLPQGFDEPQTPAPPGAPVDPKAVVISGDKANRRLYVRFAVEDCTLRLSRVGGHLTPHSYPVKDMSRGGIAFRVGVTPGLGAGLVEDDELFLSVDVQAFPDPIEMTGIVTRVKEEGEGTYVIGVKLTVVSPIDSDRIKRLEESEKLRRQTRESRK